MSTFSVFRRNQKKLLAVLGVLTMLSFVFIPTLEQCSGRFAPGSQAVFKTKMFGNISGSQFETLSQRMNSVYMVLSGGNYRGLDAQSVAATWLKSKFAQKNGFVVADSEIRDFIVNAFESKEAYEEALENTRMTKVAFEEGLVDIILASKYENYCLAGIGRQMNMYGMPFAISAFPQTVQQQWDYFCTVYRNASIEVMPIRAEDFVSKVQEPTELEAKEYFESRKEVLANTDAGVVGFKVPRKMRVQYFAYTKPVETIDEGIPLELGTPEATPAEAVPAPESINLEEATPAETTPAEVAPVETAPAEVAPAETTPAEATPAETTPAEVAPAEATPAPETAPQASVSANPFRFVADETVTTEPAPAEAYDGKVFSKLVQADLSAHKSAVSQYEFNQPEGMEKPVLTFSAETKAYMEKYGIQYVELELMTVTDLVNEPIANASGFEMLGMKTFASVEAEDMTNKYVVWFAETQVEEVPEWNDDIKKTVVAAMKLEKAKELAAEAAEASAKACTEAKALSGTVLPAAIENFSRCTMNVEGFPTPTSLDLYPQLENVDESFRTAVFQMMPGEIKAISNRNQTVFYVTQVKTYSPNDEDLRAMFESMKENPQFAQMAMMASSQMTNFEIQQWQVSLFEEAGAQFVETANPYEE